MRVLHLNTHASSYEYAALLRAQLSRLPDLGGIMVLAFGEGAVRVSDRLDVRFTGGIRERHDLARLFAAADIFVSALLMETYGLTLMEAMACGTPVMAFRTGGIPESAPDEQVALLCKARDGSALLAAIERLRPVTWRLPARAKVSLRPNSCTSMKNAFARDSALYRVINPLA
jgi:glycosyltransferase involved in cell wall biosynthesis